MAWAMPLEAGAAEAEAPSLDEARRLWRTGQYEEGIRVARTAVEGGAHEEEWRLGLATSYLATGQYSNALEVVTNALRRYTTSVRTRLLAREIFLFNGRADQARVMLAQINYLAMNRMWAYRDSENLTALGRAALLLGADARSVLEQFFDQAKARDAKLRDIYLASGQLALDKGDYQLAARVFQEGLEVHPEDPELHYGLARAFAPSDRRQMLASLETALSYNTNHVPSYVLLADHLVDGEAYEEAVETLSRALTVNPWDPSALAYRAVIAHLQGHEEQETRFREAALAHWTNNPAVDYLMGRKLSQKYRFREGADRQRQALVMDPEHLPARIQLAQDLLRLGEELEGWKLAEAAHEADGYDVTTFNLVNLKEVLGEFATVTNSHFVVRMAAREAALYGERALELLEEARAGLCAKYGLELAQPVVVEIFPDQKDFGVRTFGMPDNPGFLGVCFGAVITANSPASRPGSPNNWEAVLWHEFCHVVTLQLTRNKMPRWLSEGISVYEERQANPAWGQIMNPQYRQMILEGELTPLGELSAAFLAPRSDLHLQFAYYQSYLAVDFLVRRFGLEALRRILADLGQGREINAAIVRHTAALEELEPAFETFAREQAEALGPGLDWTRPDSPADEEARPEWLAEQTHSYYGLLRQAREQMEAEQWEEAARPLRTLIELYPDQRGPDNAYWLLSRALRELGQTEEERIVLSKLALQDGDALDTYLRLMEIERDLGNWAGVVKNVERYLAVNPLRATPYRFMGEAAEALEERDQAMAAYERLLLLDPVNPAELHFALARLMHEAGRPGAKRHVLQALEEAPRYREAHRLLLEITSEEAPSAKPSSPPVSSP